MSLVSPILHTGTGNKTVFIKANFNEATEYTVPKPANAVEGDLVLFTLINAGVADEVITFPDDVIVLINQLNVPFANGASSTVFYKVMGDNEPDNYTVTRAQANVTPAVFSAVRITGFDPDNILDVAPSFLTVFSGTPPSVTTVTDNCLVVHIFTNVRGDPTPWPLIAPHGGELVFSERSGTSSSSRSHGLSYLIQEEAGATPTGEEWATATGRRLSGTIAIRPDPNPPSQILDSPTSTSPGSNFDILINGDVSSSGNTATLVEIGGVEQTIVESFYSEIDNITTVSIINVDQHNLKFGYDYSLDVTLLDSSVISANIDLVPQAGKFFVNLVDPSTEEGSALFGYVSINGGVPETGMQLESTVYPFDEQAFPLDPPETLGNFELRLWRNDIDGWTEWVDGELFDVSEDDTPPSTINVDFTFTVVENVVQFTPNVTYSGSDSLQYSWSFGDNNTSNSQSPEHEYSEYNQSYNVTLSVTDGKVTDQITKQVSTAAQLLPYRIVLSLVKGNKDASPNMTDITLCVRGGVLGDVIFSDTSCNLVNGTIDVSFDVPDVNVGDLVYISLYKAGETRNDDVNGCGFVEIIDGMGT